MTKARDLANIISGGFTASDIPNLDASKITSGSIADARIPNLATSKITSGTFADARLSASSVSQHASSFDDNAIVNDLSTLALRSATSENAIAYSTSNQFVDVFQDASGVASNTSMPRNAGEFHASVIQTGTAVPTGTQLYLKSNSATNNSTTVSDSSGNNVPVSFNSGAKNIADANSTIIGTSTYWIDGSDDRVQVSHSDFSSRGNFGTGAFTIAGYFRFNSVSSHKALVTFGGYGNSVDYSGWSWMLKSNNTLNFFYRSAGNNIIDVSNSAGLTHDTWYHLAVTRTSAGLITLWKNGTALGTHSNQGNIIDFGDNKPLWIGQNADTTIEWAGRFDDIIINKGYDLYTSSFTPRTSYYGLTTVASATGNFISNAITASSTTKMGGIITYQDNAGTNSLNTDIVLQLSANNGSNFTTATLTALPNLSTGIKMAKVNDLTVTAGTQLKYKILLANQSAGSKEARIRGVSLQY